MPVAIDFHTWEKKINGYFQLSGYQHSLKYLLLHSTEETHTGLEQLKGEQSL